MKSRTYTEKLTLCLSYLRTVCLVQTGPLPWIRDCCWNLPTGEDRVFACIRAVLPTGVHPTCYSISSDCFCFISIKYCSFYYVLYDFTTTLHKTNRTKLVLEFHPHRPVLLPRSQSRKEGFTGVNSVRLKVGSQRTKDSFIPKHLGNRNSTSRYNKIKDIV